MKKMLENLTNMTDKDLESLEYNEIDQLKEEIAGNISSRIEYIKLNKDKNAIREITDEEIANHVGLSRSSLNQWKNGSSDVPTDTLLTVMRLAKYCECSVDELLYGDSYTKKENELVKKEALTDKSIQTIKRYTPKYKSKSLFTGETITTIPNYNRLLNYIICKKRNKVVEVDGYVGDLKNNMLYAILKEVDGILTELNKIKSKNKDTDIINMSYNELKDNLKIPDKILNRINNLPNIAELYIKDEYDKNVDDII